MAELNFLNKQVERHEIWIKNTTEMMFVGAQEKSGTGLILHHGEALETIGFTDLKNTSLNIRNNAPEQQEIYDADGKLLSGN